MSYKLLCFIILTTSCIKLAPTRLPPKDLEIPAEVQRQSYPIDLDDPRCTYGGTLFTSWVDQEKIDGIYTEGKDKDYSEKVVCFTVPTGSVNTVTKPGDLKIIATDLQLNDTDCLAGGKRYESFIDVDGNGLYDANIDTNYNSKKICNGINGTSSTTTSSTANSGVTVVSLSQKALILSEAINPGDSVCSAGGTQLTTCIDSNGDSQCTSGTDMSYSTQKICNGSGAGFLVITENAGSNCKAGGYRLDRFQDNNNNSVYDVGTDTGYTSTYICNGLNWISKSTTFLKGAGTATDNTACTNGGVRFEFG